jgi:hypothetical protein
MTTPTAVFREVAKGRGDLRVYKDLLVVPPVTHILRCFAFERRITKGEFLLWRTVLPLYRKTQHLVLNYSVRIGRGGNHLFPLGHQTAKAAADELEAVIEGAGHLDFLKAIETPKDFLATLGDVDFDTERDRKKLMDVALSYWIDGDRQRCQEILTRALALPLTYAYESEVQTEIAAILGEIQRAPSLVDSRIAAWEAAARLALLGEHT